MRVHTHTHTHTHGRNEKVFTSVSLAELMFCWMKKGEVTIRKKIELSLYSLRRNKWDGSFRRNTILCILRTRVLIFISYYIFIAFLKLMPQ